MTSHISAISDVTHEDLGRGMSEKIHAVPPSAGRIRFTIWTVWIFFSIEKRKKTFIQYAIILKSIL